MSEGRNRDSNLWIRSTCTKDGGGPFGIQETLDQKLKVDFNQGILLLVGPPCESYYRYARLDGWSVMVATQALDQAGVLPRVLLAMVRRKVQTFEAFQLDDRDA